MYYGLDDQEFDSRKGRGFSFLQNDHTSSEALQNLNLIQTIGSFLAVKRPEHVSGP